MVKIGKHQVLDMDLFNLKLIEIIFRYAHVFAIILWIGNSYFFVYADNKIQKNITDKGIDAEGILQHSGIFYKLSRFKGVPDQFEKLEKNLVIFKWQATTAFLTGVFLLVIIYYKNAQFLIIDPRVNSTITPMIGIIASIVSIGFSWFFYHMISKSKLRNNKAIFVAILFLFSVVVTYILAQIFSQRFLFFSVGLTLSVIMFFNVWFLIIPNQKSMVSAALNKTDFDLNLSLDSKRRSLDNNLLTPTVLLAMIYGHMGIISNSKYSIFILFVFAIISGFARHLINLRNQKNSN